MTNVIIQNIFPEQTY